MSDETLVIDDILGPGGGQGAIIPGSGKPLGNERNTVFDDEPAASGDEGGYKRSLW